MPITTSVISGTVAHTHGLASADGGYLLDGTTGVTPFGVYPFGTSNPMIKVSKTFADISSLEMPIYTLEQAATLVNVFADITQTFDVSTSVTVGDSADPDGLLTSADWTASTGLSNVARGNYITSFKTMLNVAGNTDIKAYGFSTTGGGGTNFEQTSSDGQEELDGGGGGRSQLGQKYLAGQSIVGEPVCSATFYIASPSESSTGTVKCYIRDGTTPFGIRATSTTETNIDASELTASYDAHTFVFDSTVTINANDLIMVSFADGDIGSPVIKCRVNAGDMTDGELWDVYGGTYAQKGTASMKQIITYDCVPVTGDTTGEIDFYLQVVD